MELINPLVQRFAESHTTPLDSLLQEIESFTNTNHTDPHMLSGSLQGKLLEMVSVMIRPKRVLEIGTFMGFSGLCLAKGLTEDGHLHTLEIREEDAQIAQGFINRSIYRDKITIHVGDAADIIRTLNEKWDLVFIDADKPAYINYFNLVFSSLNKNGFILADNVFFHGEALAANPTGKSAKGIAAFNKFINERNDVEKIMITLRDGLYLIRKL